MFASLIRVFVPSSDAAIPAVWKRAAVGLLVLVVCAQCARLTVHLKGDFDVHWESGRRMVAGEPLYAQASGQDDLGHNYPYPPFWALVHAPFSFLPILPGQLLLYPLIVVAAVGLVMTLNRVTHAESKFTDDQQFLIVAGAVFLSSRFLVRDMPECGVNLALVALSWWAVRLWQSHKDWSAGAVLGFAISLKCTPALFAAWFLWKRQWKVVGTTMVSILAFSVSPILLMGPQNFGSTMAEWGTHVWRSVGETHPAYGVLGDEPLQNVSLRPALARYLTVLPEGHRSRFAHPAYVDVFDLSPRTASWLIKAVLLGLLGWTAFQFRQPANDRENPTWLWEAACVSLLILLLSPITWGQHCVGVFPAFYLLMQRRISREAIPAWATAVIWMYIVGVLFCNREIIGKEWTYLLDSYRLPTLFLVGLFFVTVKVRHLVAVKAECESGTILPLLTKTSEVRESLTRRAG